MGLVSPPWFNYPHTTAVRDNEPRLSLITSHYCTQVSLYSSSPTSPVPTSLFDCDDSVRFQKRCRYLSWTSLSQGILPIHKRVHLVRCSQLKIEDDLDVEACELVNGSEVQIGEGSDRINALFFSAVKNNNGTGILLLSDIFGFEDSYNRDFAYRVACNGYNVLVPDLFRGDPWSRDRSRALLKEWLTKQDPTRVAADITASTKWMVDEFEAAGSTNKLGIIGFCYGGGRVLLDVLAKDQNSTFGAGVSFYGTRMDLTAAQKIKVPVLFVAGDNDPQCPVESLHKVESKIECSSKVVIYKGRGHAFVHRPASPEEDEDAEEAFMIMRNWLSEHLLNRN